MFAVMLIVHFDVFASTGKVLSTVFKIFEERISWKCVFQSVSRYVCNLIRN